MKEPYSVRVLRLAAVLRCEHYLHLDAALLAWGQLTDAQKVPWIVGAAKRIGD